MRKPTIRRGGKAKRRPSSAGLLEPMEPADLAATLRRVGRGGVSITAADIQRDIAAGAPASADGRLGLVDYAAWLVGQLVVAKEPAATAVAVEAPPGERTDT